MLFKGFLTYALGLQDSWDEGCLGCSRQWTLYRSRAALNDWAQGKTPFCVEPLSEDLDLSQLKLKCRPNTTWSVRSISGSHNPKYYSP